MDTFNQILPGCIPAVALPAGLVGFLFYGKAALPSMGEFAKETRGALSSTGLFTPVELEEALLEECNFHYHVLRKKAVEGEFAGGEYQTFWWEGELWFLIRRSTQTMGCQKMAWDLIPAGDLTRSGSYICYGVPEAWLLWW